MRNLTYLALTLLTLCAQTAIDPLPVARTATLTWAANDPIEGVTSYVVYRIVSGERVERALVTTTNSAPLVQVLPDVGAVYALYVTAVNPQGESAPSTNLWVRYWPNKATPPRGLGAR